MIFVRLVFYIFYIFFLLLFFLIVFCLLSYVLYMSLRLEYTGQPDPTHINIDTCTCIIRIPRKRPDIYYLINEVFMQRPLRRLRNLIWLLFLYILFVLVEMKQSISFLTKSK